MNHPHQNVRTTFYSRALMVQRVLKEGKGVRESAEALGVSRRTVYKWLARYRAGGHDALHNRSSRPRRSPRRLPVGRVATIAGMRRMGMNSPQIAFSLSLPLSSVALDLRRLGLQTPNHQIGKL
ncbi:MAG: leucine zipper domain-containing protein [Thermodesulfobacteriota bacterium]